MKTFQVVATILVLLGLAGGFIYTVVMLGKYISDLGPQPAATLIAAMLTLVGVLVTVLFNQSANRRAERDKAQLARRSDAYQKMTHDLLKFMQMSKAKSKTEAENTQELANSMTEFAAHALVWGSPPVIKAWNRYRYRLLDLAEGESVPARENLQLLGELVMAMRSDLGHRGADIMGSDLLRTFINDLEEGKPI